MFEGKKRLLEAAVELAAVVPGVEACDLIDSVKKYSMCAAVSATGIGWIRGLGATIATTVSSGFVSGMLCKLNNMIDVNLEKSDTKKIAASILQTVAPISAAALISSTGISFIPFLGQVTSMGVMSIICRRTTMASGAVYLKTIKHILDEKGTTNEISTDEICQAADQLFLAENFKELI